MLKNHWKRYIGIGAAGVALAYTALDLSALADPPPREGAATLSGAIAEFVKNDRGDVDGIKLESGGHIHFPPHIGAKVTQALSVHDEIAVNGHQETRRRGERVFVAENIAAEGVSIDVVPPPGPVPHGRRSEQPMHAAGIVSEVEKNPHDDVDGFTLEDGTVVKFPPHQGSALEALISAGSKVEVDGRRHETPTGDVHLHADRITATDSGKSLERSEPRNRPLPPPHHAGPPHAGPHAHAGPHDGGLQEEILHELREIRRLLEDRSAH